MLPDDPRLAEIARELDDTQGAALLCDPEWKLVWVSNELKVLLGETDDERLGIGKHIIEAYLSEPWGGQITEESQMKSFMHEFPIFLHDSPGGREEFIEILCRAIDEHYEAPPEWMNPPEGMTRQEAVDKLLEMIEAAEPPALWTSRFDFVQGEYSPVPVNQIQFRLRDNNGEFFGTAVFYDPGLPARVLTMLTRGDEQMYRRMAALAKPGRRQAAILFADLQASGEISRRLPSAAYFRLVRSLTTAMDEVIVKYNGIVGKHAGDGLTAFFLSDDLGSSSSAARGAIEAGREISVAAGRVAKEIAEETGLIDPSDCQVNVGVHWGGTLYMGQLVTGGRLEVTALGDPVNECARIQETARDGEALASKTLMEHLSDEDADELGIDPDNCVYRTVSELPSASDKARRDAGGIPVTVL